MPMSTAVKGLELPRLFVRRSRATHWMNQIAVPNLLIDHAMRNPHIPPHFWCGGALQV
jgi:hypothetical protein